MTNKANNKNEMTKKEQMDTRGGRKAPSPKMRHAPGRLMPPTWKYVDGTPDWAKQAALAMGYEIEAID